MTAGYEGEVVDIIDETVEVKTRKVYIVERHDWEINVMYRDIHMKKICTYSDYYGKNSGKQLAIYEAGKLVIAWGIKPEENIYVTVTELTYHTKKKKVLEEKKHWYERQYEDISHTYPKEVKSEVVWNSKEDMPNED